MFDPPLTGVVIEIVLEVACRIETGFGMALP